MQDPSARFQGRACCAHIINQEHCFPRNSRAMKPRAACGERVCNVRLSAVRGQFNLRPRREPPDEGANDRQPKVTRDLTRLIETPLVLATPMQGNRH